MSMPCLWRSIWAGGSISFILDEVPGEMAHQYSCTDDYKKQAEILLHYYVQRNVKCKHVQCDLRYLNDIQLD